VRPTFYDFPSEVNGGACGDASDGGVGGGGGDAWMAGPCLLAAPVVEPGARSVQASALRLLVHGGGPG
jgi:alpha-glucosidase (family GH31 glycosyl hydrolase)